MPSKHTEEFVPVNGIEHFLLHYPKEPDAPVLLYLHGGPGSFESLFAFELDAQWGDMFTHVHWDQRGAGKTLRRNKKTGLPQSIEQMADDLHGIVRYLREKYQAERIALMGHSWGSLLGSIYTLRHPENVLCYIGTGQVISPMENERAAYRQVVELATGAGHRKHIEQLQQLGHYPPDDFELLMKLLPKVRKIQEAYDSSADSGTGLGEMIKTCLRSPSFRWSDFISFLQVMKVNRPLHRQMFSFDLGDTAPRYLVPVHYILGEVDTTAPVPLGKAYYDTIEAPDKTFTIIPRAGHNPMFERPAAFAAALRAVRERL